MPIEQGNSAVKIVNYIRCIAVNAIITLIRDQFNHIIKLVCIVTIHSDEMRKRV